MIVSSSMRFSMSHEIYIKRCANIYNQIKWCSSGEVWLCLLDSSSNRSSNIISIPAKSNQIQKELIWVCSSQGSRVASIVDTLKGFNAGCGDLGQHELNSLIFVRVVNMNILWEVRLWRSNGKLLFFCCCHYRFVYYFITWTWIFR